VVGVGRGPSRADVRDDAQAAVQRLGEGHVAVAAKGDVRGCPDLRICRVVTVAAKAAGVGAGNRADVARTHVHAPDVTVHRRERGAGEIELGYVEIARRVHGESPEGLQAGRQGGAAIAG